MTRRKLKIGFDFDGVIAYNPLRVLRAPLNFFMQLIFKKKIIGYYPQSKGEQFFWKLAHKTSYFPACGFSQLKQMLKKGEIEGYLVTGRYNLLEDSLKHWLKRNKADDLFKGYFVNNKNEHPHEFKEKMIKKLGLDAFVEDNWDIVDYLNKSLGNPSSKLPTSPVSGGVRGASKVQSSKLKQIQNSNVNIYWIYNLLDRFKPYDKKHPHLKSFIEKIKLANSK